MNKEEFIKELVTAIEEEIPANVYDKINVKTIEKDNNRTYTGITIMNGKISPTLNADAFYEEYMETGDIYSIINEAKEIILQETPEIDLEEITDYDKAKEHLIMVLRDKEMNEYLLDSVPYVEKGDFVVMFKLSFQMNEIGNGNVLIRNEELDRWGISKEQLYEDALQVTKQNTKPFVFDMVDFMMNLCEIETYHNLLENPKDFDESYGEIPEPRLLVITNDMQIEGASVILNNEVLDKVSEIFGDSFYIIPSSIHECIASREGTAKDLNQMIKEVNETQVPEKDILSYKAQFYDADAKILMNAKAYEEQKKFKSHTENVKSEENTINKAVEKDKKNLNYEEKHREERIR